MFRSKHIFEDLHAYVDKLNLTEKESCSYDISIQSEQIGGRKGHLSLNNDKNGNDKEYESKFGLNQRGVFPAVKRIVAIGDIHGDFKALLKVLHKANIINTNGDWDDNNKNTIVIQLGDLLDRGGRGYEDTTNFREEIDILQYIEHLHKQASDPKKKLNSAFITLIGNHELMNILGDFRYVSENAMKGMGGEEGRRNLFLAGGPIAKHIGCCSYGICKIGDWTFVHAGVLPQHLKDDEFSFSNINNMVRKIMRGELQEHDLNPSQREFIFGNNGIFWTRELSKNNPNCSLANESVHILNNGNGENGGIVVGHTVQKQINSKCGGKVWAIDNGMSDAFGKSVNKNIQVLEILNNSKVNIL
jgi:hypothetical protein